MTKISLIKILVWLFVSVANQVCAEEMVITIAATEWRPYMSEKLPGKGVIPEIAKVAFEKSGYKAVFEFYPWKRLLALTKNGAVDAAIGVSYTDERTSYFLYPKQTIFEDRKVIFYSKDNKVIKNFTGNLKDLCPDRVGVVDGSYLEKQLEEVECILVEPADTVELNFRKFMAGRIKYMLESETSIKLLLSTQGFPETETNKFGVYETPVDIDRNFAVFSKKAAQQKPYLQSVLKSFDENLAQMKTDGTYDKILREFGM